MAKPINPYQGAAPAAMGQMGAGILEAGARIGQSLQKGYESMGQGLASGVNAAASAYGQYKDDQAKFDATKKLFNAFESYLPKQKDPETGKEFSPMGDQIRSMFDDTSISVRDKNAMAPMLLSFLGNAQQQYGRESVANIMAGSRAKPAMMPSTGFGEIPTVNKLLNTPVGQPQAQPQAQTNQQQGSPMVSADGNSVYNPKTGKWVRLDNNAMTGDIVPDNYYDNSDNLMFDPVTRRIIEQ
jgi:hypothetical protein